MRRSVWVATGQRFFGTLELKFFILCIATVMGLGGCDILVARYADASTDASARNAISTYRTTKTDLLLLGVDSYPSKRTIENYVLVQPPGFDGPEVLSRSLVPRGARIYITGAQRCINCFSRNLRLSVKLDGLATSVPVYIDISLIGLLQYEEASQGRP